MLTSEFSVRNNAFPNHAIFVQAQEFTLLNFYFDYFHKIRTLNGTEMAYEEKYFEHILLEKWLAIFRRIFLCKERLDFDMQLSNNLTVDSWRNRLSSSF